MYIRTSELRQLDVVNVLDGKILGNVCDVDLDPATGKLRFLVLEQAGSGFWRFLKYDDIEIPWNDVILVGADVVLVEMKQKYSTRHQTWRRRRF